MGRHKFRFFALLGMLFDEVGEEEQLQYDEDDEQLDKDDSPQRPSQLHFPESVVVKVKYPMDKIVFHLANIHFFI